MGNAFGNDADTPDLIADTIGALMRMQKTEAKAEYTLRDAMSIAYKAAQEAKALGGAIPGIPTGIEKLDNLLGGWHDSDLIVLGSRPAMGKTAALVNFALACGVPCGIISAEQPAAQLGSRAMSARSHVEASKFRNGAFDDDDIGRLMRAVAELIEHPCMIYDRSSPTIADVVRMARKWKHNDGIRVLFVDYVQRIEASNFDRRTPKHERVGEVVKGLKTLARDLDIPVVALCQVGRQVEQRTDKRPSMGDMSDSSEIEKEADQILTLYREAVYFDAGGVNERGQPVRPNVAEINVEKNRHGPCGYVECVWIPESMRFEDMGRG
jgi:replicative DNA helicase